MAPGEMYEFHTFDTVREAQRVLGPLDRTNQRVMGELSTILVDAQRAYIQAQGIQDFFRNAHETRVYSRSGHFDTPFDEVVDLPPYLERASVQALPSDPPLTFFVRIQRRTDRADNIEYLLNRASIYLDGDSLELVHDSLPEVSNAVHLHLVKETDRELHAGAKPFFYTIAQAERVSAKERREFYNTVRMMRELGTPGPRPSKKELRERLGEALRLLDAETRGLSEEEQKEFLHAFTFNPPRIVRKYEIQKE